MPGAHVMGMHVAGRDRRDAQRLGQLGERGVAARVAALVRPLQLDVERAAEMRARAGRRVRVDDAEPVARAAGERDEPFGVLGDHLDGRLGAAAARAPGRAAACARARR